MMTLLREKDKTDVCLNPSRKTSTKTYTIL